jgi:ubiquinol-cytochrome c reductase subunit 7
VVLVLFAGLMRDDTIHEDGDVKEALRRLPEKVYNDRMFRLKRALDLSMKQAVLPKEQWTQYEEVWKTCAQMPFEI